MTWEPCARPQAGKRFQVLQQEQPPVELLMQALAWGKASGQTRGCPHGVVWMQ